MQVLNYNLLLKSQFTVTKIKNAVAFIRWIETVSYFLFCRINLKIVTKLHKMLQHMLISMTITNKKLNTHYFQPLGID